MKKELYKAYFALALVSFFWGTTFVAARIGAQHMPGLFVAGLRQFLSGVIMVGFFMARGYRLPEWKVLRQISIQGILLLCIANGMLTWSMEYITGGLAAIIVALVPMFIALFSIWFSKCNKISRWMMFGLVAGFVGVVIIFSDYIGQFQNKSFAFGVGLAFVSVIVWSFGTVYSSRHKQSIEVLFNVGLQMLIAGIVILTVCAITGKFINPVNAGQESLLSILYLVVFGSLIAYSAYVFAISKLPPTLVSIYAYINPIVAVLFGWLILSEKLNPSLLLGSLITIAGIYLVNREFKKVKQ